MLKSCVSRSIAARTGSGVPSTSTVAAPSGGAGIGSVGSSSASQPVSAVIHGAPQDRTEMSRAHVVFREE